MQDKTVDEEVQANLPETVGKETNIKIRPLEGISFNPKQPIKESTQGRGKNYSRPWILKYGPETAHEPTIMRESYKIPKKPQQDVGIRKRILTDFFWEQMLDEVIEELATSQPVTEYCSEYDANYVKDEFEPRNFGEAVDKNTHLKYPLYGTGSSAITFYSETMHKIGPGEILEKFRRCQYFTKPMEERLDDGWVL